MSKLIPAPTVSGVLPPRLRQQERPNAADDTRASYWRTQRSLESHLQELLDAQSVGLAAQLGQQDEPDTRSSTSASQSRPLITLRNARHGISRTIDELAHVKTTESGELRGQLREVEDLLSRGSDWSEQRQGIQHDIDNIDQREQNALIHSLTEEHAMVQEQINAMEEKLNQLRSHQKNINARLSEVRNKKESELSSYQTSLRTVDSNIAQFLRRPMPEILARAKGPSALLSLPVKRRTLDMVIEHAKGVEASLNSDLDGLRAESLALEDGSALWQQAVEMIEDFERHLRQATKSLPAATSVAQGDQQEISGRPDILPSMRDARASLEGMLEQAEEKGWTLLIAAIGAELEAFKQGQEFLETLLSHNNDSLSQPSSEAPSSAKEIEDPSSLLLSHPHDQDDDDDD